VLRVLRKLPRDVLQGCYGATDAVIYRLRSDMRIASKRPVRRSLKDTAHLSSDVMDKTDAIAPADVGFSGACLLPRGQNVPGGRTRKRRGSKNQISMTAPMTAAATQQVAARAGA
jgi:hypothetical protein